MVSYLKHKSKWENPAADDNLLCECKVGNPYDTHTVPLLSEKVSLAKVQQCDIFHEESP